MARERSSTPARSKGAPLAAGLLVPLAIVAAVIAVAVAVVATSGGQRATNTEVDARAANVKKTWDAVGRPTAPAQLDRLGTRLNARLRVVPGGKAAPGTTRGNARTYQFATRGSRAWASHASGFPRSAVRGRASPRRSR